MRKKKPVALKQFMVRLPPAVIQEAKVKAALAGKTIQSYIAELIQRA